jgi:hypothetical protein
VANTNKYSPSVSIWKVWPEFETKAQALERRAKLVRQLLDGDRSALQLATKLAGCNRHRRCGSPICHVCVGELRCWFICETIACFNELCAANPSALRGKVVRFSGVPCEEEYPEGGLNAANLHRLNRRMQKPHERAGLPVVFAGVDVSLNVFDNSKSTKRWQIHFYGAVIGRTREHVRTALSDLYPIGKNTWRPLDVKCCNNLAAVVSYAIKPYFYRRSGYVKPATGRRDTWEEPLKGSEIRELAVWLDQYRLADRYLLRGCRRRRGKRIVIDPAVRAQLLGLQ